MTTSVNLNTYTYLTWFVVNTLMENISFRIFRICIFVYATELQQAQLSSVPEPCPDIAPGGTIANMCTTDFTSEEPSIGSKTVNSVALRVMTQQDGCTCEVSLQNQYNTHTIYMRKYDLLTSAAPEQERCGLAIDIAYISPANFQEKKASIQCTKGTTTSSVSLSKNRILYLRSRIIGGDFTRGYCIQIYREHITGDKIGIQINCSLPDLQTTTQDKTVSSNMQTTQQMTNDAIQDETAPDKDATLYIVIGVGSAVIVISFFVVVFIMIIRGKGNKNKNNIEVQPDIGSNDRDSDGLKYNTLYHATDQQEIMEGNYHVVELNGKQNRTDKQNFDSDYSAVDGNYSSVDVGNKTVKDGSKTDNRIQLSSTTKPRSETQRTEEETSNTLKHVTAGSNAEYAIVNKSRTDQNINHVTAPDDSNAEYAVVDKKKLHK